MKKIRNFLCMCLLIILAAIYPMSSYAATVLYTYQCTDRNWAEGVVKLARNEYGNTLGDWVNYFVFESTYRPKAFGGSKFPHGNDKRYPTAYKVNDGKYDVNIYGAKGCQAYAYFVSKVVYGEDHSTKVFEGESAGNVTANGLKQFITYYAQPGENVRFGNVPHSVSYVACEEGGFWYLNYPNDDNPYISLDFVTYDKAATFCNTYKDVPYIYNSNKNDKPVNGDGSGSGGSGCGCSEANAGYYKVTATDGLSVNSGHNFNSKCGELSYGQVVKVSKASGTGGVSGTYGHIVYNGKECYIAMKYMTRASDSEVCATVGHDKQTIPGKAASCTASGLTDGVRCTRCGATITSQQTIPAMGHTFGSWRDKSAATCTAQATHVAVCGRCGSEYGSVTPYGDYVQHIQDPNNKEYCKVCGQKCFEEEVQEGISAWTKADEAPDGVEIVNRKWSYTKREYTTSSNSELPGWVQYKTTSAWNDYGGWSDWQNSAVSGSDSRQVDTRWIEPVTQHRYNYYRYINSAHNYYATTKGYNGCNTLEELSLTSPLTLKSTSGGVEAYGTAQCNESASGAHSAHQRNSWLKDSVRNRAFETDVVISPGYTQYRYRDRSLSYTYYYYKDSSMDSDTKPSGEDISNVTEWVKYKTNICVTFSATGGSSPIASKNVTLGDTYGELPTPTRAGYTFAGWYTEAAGGTQVTDKTPVNGAANHTLYAHWEAISYKVSFDANEGTISVTEKSVLFGSVYGELPTPIRGGYDFLGWYNDRENGVAVTNETVVDTAADHTLYAQWEKQDPCAAGHTFGRWAEKTPATCTTQATRMAVCSVCDQEYGDFVPYGDLAPHTYGEWTVVREATVEETGLKRRTCTACGHDEEQEIEKLPPVVDENAPQIVMGTATGRAGNTVDVTISLKNNPGINSVRIAVGYDTNAMTLTAIKDAGLLGELSNDPSQMSKSPYTIVWEGDKFDKNFTDNGTIATLTFAVKEGVSEGTYPITISYDEDKYDIMDVNMEIVHLDVVNGGVAVKNVIIGDADGDGEVTPRDRVILSRYLSNWGGYAEKINLAAADTDDDGVITTRDRVVLSRYLSKWNGYTALPYKK